MFNLAFQATTVNCIGDIPQLCLKGLSICQSRITEFALVIVLAVVIAAFGFILGIGSMITDNLVFGLICFLSLVVAASAAGYIGYYNNVGKTAKQWNALLKEFYPDICSKYKL